MHKLNLVAYCGLYCGLCTARNRISQQAKALKKTMADWELWANDMPNFNEFWQFLADRCDPDKCCSGCRNGNGGPPSCGIRKCAKKKQIDICVFCEDFPCDKIDALAEGYPTLIADGKRLKKIGLDQWLSEQYEREKTGFAYADIRCYPYHVPED